MSHGSPVHHENGLSCGPAVGLGDVGILLVPRESVLSLTRELPVPRTVASSTPSRIAAEEALLGRAGGGAPGLSPRYLRSRLLAPRGARPLPPPLRGCPPRPSRRPGSSRSWRRPPTATPSSRCGSSTPSARTAVGGCARPRCSSVGSLTSCWAQLSSNRGQVGGGNAASVRRGITGNRCRMCVVVIKILKLP